MIVIRKNCLQGQGGSATVYLAENKSGQELALKVSSGSEQSDALLLNEWKVLNLLAGTTFTPRAYAFKTLHSPGYDFLNGKRCIEMEFLRGSSLEHIATRGRLSEKEGICVAMHAFKAGEIVQAHDLVHRDLHPGNLLITDKGELKIIDFGTSCSAHEAEHGRSAIQVVNGHEPPETVGTACPIWTKASDVFTLASSIVWAVMGDAGIEGLPDTVFVRWAKRCLDRNPTHRFRTCSEALRALEKTYPRIAEECRMRGNLLLRNNLADRFFSELRQGFF